MKSKGLIIILLLVVIIGYFIWKRKQNEEPEYFNGTLGEDISKGIAGYSVAQTTAEEDEVQRLVRRYKAATGGYLPEEGLSLDTLRELTEQAEEKANNLIVLTGIKGNEGLLQSEARQYSDTDIKIMIDNEQEAARDKWSAKKSVINKLVQDTRSWLQAYHKFPGPLASRNATKQLKNDYKDSVNKALSLATDEEKIYFMDNLASGKVKVNIAKYGDSLKINEYSNLDKGINALKSNIAKKFTEVVSMASSLQDAYKRYKNSGLTSASIDAYGGFIKNGDTLIK